MYLYFILAALTSLIMLLPTNSIRNDWYDRKLQDDHSAGIVLAYGKAIEKYFDANHSYPDSLNDLDANEQLPDGELLLYKKTEVVDSKDHISYEKYILATSKKNHPLSEQFLEENQCGDKTFTEGEAFCGKNDAYWMVNDSKTKIRALTALQSQRLNSTALRFFENNQFPITPTGRTISLRSAVGTVNCTQPNTFSTVSLSCLDIYSVTGSDVFYQYITPKHGILFSVMPFTDENGQNHIVAKELKK
ncbi:hypothetical protein ABMY12_20780 [Vibrio vulnificus]|uniref:hypothetical protein n=1 Tax=Vibrio vulnificus TaxID=672 RepID=UPI0040599B10